MVQIFDPQEGSAIVYDFFSEMPGLGQSQMVEMDFEPDRFYQPLRVFTGQTEKATYHPAQSDTP